ncbi:MAG TPA: PrsW family glutamic-type intramembrane protease [Aggregatilinea sp.]|uniref:PrsW family glutamic-type intramembrane protease n=1 Tax=Aggregatilinea sp. TaxID=2806333 RepID=UPI002CE84DA4|nr:PrsW family glutamic-type intramembrane protease [Aggregatilinea sp.]HML22508.1 PrsW family glutamic-type intramembrane protease [Aggregatilinea sp.]
MSFEPILLAPEEEVIEVYPYRRVWSTTWLEVGVLAVVVVAIVVLTDFVGVLPADYVAPLPKTGMALLPFVAWLVISYRAEHTAIEPRTGMLRLLIMGALVANGVAIPLEERLFLPDRWLLDAGFFGRVLGYAFTIGFTAEFLKYAVMRYTIWPQRFQQRLDGVAYGLAVSMGFATVLNLHFALYTDATLYATALRVISNTFQHMALGIILGYFLAELRVARPPVFWIPAGLFLTAILSGFYYAFHALAIVGGLGISPLRGLMLALGVVGAALLIMAFLIESADTRMEALTGRRQLI